MKIYPLLPKESCAELVAAIRDEQWTQGKTQRGPSSVKVVQELRGEDSPAAKAYLDDIVRAISESPMYQGEFLESAYYPRFSRYVEGGEYQAHADAAYMGTVRTDLAMTLFLNDDYEGGELCIDGLMPNGMHARVKAPAGQAVVYECWRPHWVNPVTRGERFVAVTWLQSRIPSVEDRELLSRLHSVIDDLTHKKMTEQQRFAVLGAVHTKLQKRFATH